MATPNPSVLVNGLNPPQILTAHESVTIALSQSAGVSSWSVGVLSTDDSAPTVPTITINQATFQATFTMVGVGTALLMYSTVNNNLDSQGIFHPEYTTTFKVGVLTGDGYEVYALGENLESGAYGWLSGVNNFARYGGGGGGGSPTGPAGGDLEGTYPNPTLYAIQGFPVSAATPTAGQVFTWNGVAWAPANSGGGSLAGDVTGPAGSNTISKLQGNTLSVATPGTGQILEYDGAAWVPANAPSGSFSAGGDLSGTETDQEVIGFMGRALSTAVPTSGQVYTWSGTQWVPQTPAGTGITALTGDVIASGSGSVAATTVRIQGVSVSATGPTTGQVLEFNGSEYIPTTPSSGFTAGGDLSGTSTSQTVIGLQTHPISSTAPTTGQVLEYNGSEYVPTTLSGSFSAGGDLSGSSTDQTVIGLDTVPLSITSLNTGNGLSYNGSSWVNAALNLAGGSHYVFGNLPVSNVAPGTSAQVLMSNGTPATTWTTLSGDLTVGATGTITLATVNSNTGSFGSSTSIPVITVDGKGLITAVTTATPTVSAVSGITVSGTPSSGQVLTATSSSAADWQTPSGGTSVTGTGLWYSASGTLNSAAQGFSGDVSLGSESGGNVATSVLSLTGASGAVDIASTGNILTWAAATTAPGITQTSISSGNGAALTISAQSTTGTSGLGGDVNITAGNGGTSTGEGGNVYINTGNAEYPGIFEVQIGGSENKSIEFSTIGILFGSTIFPNIFQAQTSSGSGATLTIQAQGATGASNNGGTLNLSSGSSGSATAGSVCLQAGGTQITVAPTLVTIAPALTLSDYGTGLLHSSSAGAITSSLVVDADVSSSAAIAVSKLAAGTSAQVLLNSSTPTPTWTTLSGDLTVGNTGTTTLATVNSNTGSFGSTTAIPVITVNAKGLITAVSTATPTVSVVSGITVSGTPSSGQVLTATSSTAAHWATGGGGTSVTGTGLWYSASGSLNSAAQGFSGDVSLGSESGGNIATTVVGIDGVALSITSLTAGQTLEYNGTNWVNINLGSSTSVASSINSNTTLTKGYDIYPIGTLTSSIAVTLWSSPSVGDKATLKDTMGTCQQFVRDNAGTLTTVGYITTISPATGTIDGQANYILQTPYQSVSLVCVATSPVLWSVI